MFTMEGKNMLVNFTVENYKSFKDPIMLDFRGRHDYRYNSQCIRNGLLSKVVIYGANSSGLLKLR